MFRSTYTLLTLCFLIICSITTNTFAYERDDSSIDFVNKQSFRDVQDIAYEEDKPIFITFYAVWSTPCADMEKEVFHNSKVAEFMNSNFVNYNANIETKIGKALSDYFEVYHLPTTLIITPKGKVIMKSSNMSNSKKFLKWAKEANEMYLEQKADKEEESKAVYRKSIQQPVSKYPHQNQIHNGNNRNNAIMKL